MQDRYTYRAKDIDTNKWVYGFYAELPYGLSSSGCMGEFSDVAPYILTCKTKQSSLFSNAEPHEVIVCETCKIDKKTLGQCTGLKDKNGKLIYENDIVNRNGELLIVRYQEEMACLAPQYFYLENDKIVYGSREWFEEYNSENCKLYSSNSYEIIGNIYQNKELLKSEE